MDKSQVLDQVSVLREAVRKQEAIFQDFCKSQSTWFGDIIDIIDSLPAKYENNNITDIEAFTKQAIAALSNDKSRISVDKNKPVIIPFPTPAGIGNQIQTNPNINNRSNELFFKPTIAPEGTPLPAGIYDLRPLLRRDGLILLSWKQMKTLPITYEVFWLKRTGQRRTYTAKNILKQDLKNVLPDTAKNVRPYYHVSSFEDRDMPYINYWIHVAPEEIHTSPATPDPRIEYIQKLEAIGINIGSDANFTIKGSNLDPVMKAV